MKNFIIHCNEEQLSLLCSAIELQMRVRIGQGWAIKENICGYGTDDITELCSRVLDDILRPMTINPDGRVKYERRWIDRDIWASLRQALCGGTDETALGEYGLMKVEEVNEQTR